MEAGISSPVLTVAIAAAGPVQPLLATLASLARDVDAACEILVIDDGLPEPSVLALPSTADPRVRVRRNDHPLGAVESLSRAIAEGTTSFIMLLRPGDVIVPGALDAIATVMRESPDIGLAHAYWFPVNPRGSISLTEFRRHRRRMGERLPPTLDHRRALVVEGNVVHALPTFRRAVLAAIGGLEGASLDDAVYGASLRVLARAEARLVPRVLCGRPSAAGHRRDAAGLRSYLLDLAVCARVVKDGGADYLRTTRYRFARLASVGLLRCLANSLPRGWMEGARSAAGRFLHSVRSVPPFHAVGGRPYAGLVAFLGRWSFDSLRSERGRPRPAARERVAYLLWHYPVLSETFVRREVQALRSAGVCLDVVALDRSDAAVPEDSEFGAGAVTYLGPPDTARGRAAALGYLRLKPWTVVRLWLFVVRHRYRENKTWWHDRDVLYLAAQLADMLAERGTTHIHSPWADYSALLAFLVSRLLGVTYSVQARASEIHRTALAPLAADRVRFAEFLVTNSHYNERYLRSLLDPGSDLPIHIIRDGIEPFRFHSPADRPAREPVRLLSVGRLVESKGFRYLLEACRLLSDRGVDVVCDVIGGPQDPDETVTWIELRRLHAELHLESVVRFAGAMPFSSVLTAYRGADIVVLPCVRARDGSHDVTPSTLIEAMAMRLPVVSTTIGGIPELVDHGTDGLLMPPNHADALAAALERLAGDPALRRRLGEAGRRKVEARFDMDLIVRQRASLFWLQP